MQIRNEIMHLQIKQSVTSHGRIDIQVRHSVMSNKGKNFQIKQHTVWNQITRCQTKRYFANWNKAFSNEPSLYLQWSKEILKAINYKHYDTLGLDWSPLVNVSTWWLQSTIGLDELCMRGVVWIDKSSMCWVQVFETCMSGVYEQDGTG